MLVTLHSGEGTCYKLGIEDEVARLAQIYQMVLRVNNQTPPPELWDFGGASMLARGQWKMLDNICFVVGLFCLLVGYAGD